MTAILLICAAVSLVYWDTIKQFFATKPKPSAKQRKPQSKPMARGPGGRFKKNA